ncbi:hypothetical protein DY000_02010774 [Brassica cretica]|uniref:BZIP domain-containing protein n=1 Tax=Brassica cretica TaxID=69181 RepID=A0ABQ7D685_BRACR|nr:hypothetical protein DY000_02010774 [Brassica cretica]
MGSNEEGKTTQSDKPAQVQAPPPPEQSNVHVYHHDWAAMQAYYGPRVAITPQYYNSNGHAAPYIWGSPSPMMAPYGTPYPPFCPPGGVYAHPALQMGTQPQGAVSQATPVVATPLNLEAHPANSSGNTDQGFMKKLKEFDGLAMSISNNKTGSAEHSSEPKNSQSSENDDSSNGSDGNTTGGEQSRKKRSREGSPNNDGKPSSQIVPLLRDENEKQAVTMGTPVMPTVLDFPQPRHGAPHEVWNEKEVKREKRKQSNRTPLNLEAHPANSSGNTDQGFMKKLKEFDGLAMSISNNKTGSAEHSSEPKNSQSSENDDSSNGSDGNTTGGEQSRKKRSREGSPNNDGKPSSQIVPLLRDENEKQAVTMGTPVMPTVLDFPQPRHGAPHEVWNEKEVKREKRKQSNRESARRSRLRKQAETEELSVKVDALVAENMTLRSKLGQLNDESEKLRLDNQALLDQLKAQATGKTENLISGVDKNNNSVSGSSSSSKNAEQQLLNVSLRTDSVAAS